ncbi:MAG: hypothetical protein KDD11_04940, partial [Acidobacteria bacterium]|nr:hypothetical protein [Acidobacteriota bacterium]
MLQGISLTLMIGPAVPIPAPRTVVEALTDVEVTVPTEGPSVFQLRFTLAKKSPLETLFLLAGGAVPPLLRVVLVATVNGQPEVLADGVVTGTEIAPGSADTLPTLTVRGEDLSRVMDYIELDGLPYPAMPALARVNLALLKYAVLGVIPLVIPPILMDVPIPVERIPVHQGTDLAYIKRLAEEVGYVFYVEAGPVPGTSVAYWGPEVKVGVPQPALNTDMDAHTNVEALSFSIDTQDRALPVLFIHNALTKVPIPIPVPDINPLAPPLGLVAPLPKRIEMLGDTAHLSPIQAAAMGIARASRSSEVVRGSGSLDVLRYGRVL